MPRRKVRRNPRPKKAASGIQRLTLSQLKATKRKPGVAKPSSAAKGAGDAYVPDIWREKVERMRSPGWYYRRPSSSPDARGLSKTGGWGYYKNAGKKRRKVRKSAASPKRRVVRRRRSVRRNPSRVYMMPKRRSRKVRYLRNPVARRRRRSYKKTSFRRNPASVLMFLGVAAGSAILSRVIGNYAQEKLTASLPEAVQPYTKILVQGLLAAGAVGLYMGKLKQAALKEHGQALAAGTVAALLDTLVQKYAPASVSSYLASGVAAEAQPASTPALEGYGSVDVYEAALRGLNEGWNDYRSGDTKLMAMSDYVNRPMGYARTGDTNLMSMNDYVKRPRGSSMSDYVSRPMGNVKGQQTELMALSDFNPNYKQWD